MRCLQCFQNHETSWSRRVQRNIRVRQEWWRRLEYKRNFLLAPRFMYVQSQSVDFLGLAEEAFEGVG